jgi:Fe2+ transport system protein FeoA
MLECDTLANAMPHRHYSIESVTNEEALLLLLRFGIGVGDTIEILAKLPAGGPLILQHNHTEMALGHTLAQGVQVRLAS